LSGIFLYALRHRYIRGAQTYTWLVAGQMLATLGFILELVNTSLKNKLFWDTFQWLTTAFLVILPFLLFAIQFSEYKLRAPSFTWGLILTFLGIFTTLLLTDDIHHLFYSNPRLATGYPFPELRYDFTFLIYVYLLFYVYGASLVGINIFIRRAFQPNHLFRRQYLILAAGFLFPLILSFFPLIDIQLTSQGDITPLASAIGSLIAAWGLFHYGLFDIAPIAREQVVETLKDILIVLDPRNRIVDINKAAVKFMGMQRSEVIGRTADSVLAQWPFMIELVNNRFEQRKEASLIREGQPLFFEASITHLLNQRQEFIGRIISAHEITKLKTLESNYETLSADLEKSIQKQLEELSNTAERYRTIVENHTDFILCWKPDGTRTFVNEAYCRYWDIPYEQALAMNFLFHSAQENRVQIEEKIARMSSGASDVESEVHQVIKPDGSIAWQEWADRAIRDEWGNLIEIQSVGRDITERKRAEAKLNT
jgi:PAS domain S-box-containing protein